MSILHMEAVEPCSPWQTTPLWKGVATILIQLQHRPHSYAEVVQRSRVTALFGRDTQTDCLLLLVTCGLPLQRVQESNQRISILSAQFLKVLCRIVCFAMVTRDSIFEG
jgi:hypothetical protein